MRGLRTEEREGGGGSVQRKAAVGQSFFPFRTLVAGLPPLRLTLRNQRVRAVEDSANLGERAREVLVGVREQQQLIVVRWKCSVAGQQRWLVGCTSKRLATTQMKKL